MGEYAAFSPSLLNECQLSEGSDYMLSIVYSAWVKNELLEEEKHLSFLCSPVLMI